MTITNFESGEVEIASDQGVKLRLAREAANRLIMMARMHTVAEFLEKLPSFIGDPKLLEEIQKAFRVAASSSDQWNLKEKFARLVTLTKGYESKNPTGILETISF